jgi:hypothetical protein
VAGPTAGSSRAPTGGQEPPAGGPSAPSGDEELLAADRRVLLVAVGAMIGLVLLGVLSAAVFTRSACRAIAPTPVDARMAGGEIDETLRVAFPEVDETTRQAMSSGLTAVAAQLGPLSGIANVGGAGGLASVTPPSPEPGDDPPPVEGSVAALGRITTVLDATGREVAATAELGDAATVTGDGDTLYSLALTNPLTGQVDALLPLDGLLAGQTCVDTATVATPLAFHLGAGDGQLALYRADEDGDDPRLELRDPIAGQVWTAPIELGPAPPGVMGERLDAGLGEDLIVLGRRTAAVDDPDLPVLTAVDREDGEVVWTVRRDELPAEVAAADATWVDVLAVADDVIVALSPDVGDGEAADGAEVPDDPDATAAARRGPGQLVTLDPADGAVTGTTPEGDIEVVGATATDDGDVLVAERNEDGWVATEVDERIDGAEPALAGFDELTAWATLDDGRVVALTGEGALVTDPEVDVQAVAWPFVGLDVLVHEERVTLLLGDEGGSGAVAVTFDT